MHSTAVTGHTAVVLWTELAALLVASRLLGSCARRIGQPPVVGALVAGVLLGPSVFGVISPTAFAWFLPHAAAPSQLLGALAQFSLLMLLVVLGAETDLPLMRSLGRPAATVTSASIIIPLAAALPLAFVLPDPLLGHQHERLPFALLVAGAISVSSLPVVARIVDELELVRRDVGQLALVAASVNDIYGFVLIAIGAALAGSGAGSSRLSLAIGGLVVMAAGLALAGQRIVDLVLRRVRRHGPNVSASLTVSVVAALGMAAATQALQIDAALGAFVAGIVLGRSRFQQSQAVAHLESWTTAVFAPLYFSFAGLQVDLTTFRSSAILEAFLAVLLVAAIAKFAGGMVGALAARMPTREAAALGVALNGRGAMQVIIGSVGLSLGILSDAAYSVVIMMSLVTSLLVPPLLTAAVRASPGRPSERERLEHEEELRSNVVVRGQRLLLPSRGYPNSLAAARVLHHAWPESSEVTVLAIEEEGGRSFDELEATMRAVFEGRPVRWVRQRAGSHMAEMILAEANLGYGVIALGAAEARDPRRVLSPLTDEILNRSPVPLLLVRRPRHRLHAAVAGAERPAPWPSGGFRRIVVPVTGTATSRAGQEVANNIGRRTGADIQLVHVLTRPANAREPAVQGAARTAVGAVLEEASGTASRHDVRAEPELRVGASSAEEVESVVAERGADLVVLGASVRRVGDQPFLGHTVEHVLEHVGQATVVVVVMPEMASLGAQEHVDRSAG